MKKYLVVWFLCLALIASLCNVSSARTTVGSNPTIDASTFTISPDGTSTNPSITFWNERTLGFYRSSTGVISVTGGTLSMLGGSYSLSDSDVAHGMTDVAATNIYGLLNALDAADAGGLRIQGLSDGNAIPLYIRGIIGSNNPTDTLEAISIVAAKKNGTGVQALSSTETVLQLLNNTTELLTILGSGALLISDNANTKNLAGLTVNQLAGDDEIFSFKSSDVGHSFTTDTETDTFLYGKKLSATLGGAGLWGLSDGDATGLQLTGGIGIADPTNTISAVVINGVKLNGTTYGALSNPETVFQVQNNATPLMTTLGSGSTSFINSVFATPIITKGPAAVAAGFVGTVTAAASTTVTFSSAADAILAGYDASNPVLGVTLISNALTRYIVSWTNATTAVVDTAVTWAGTAITSIQFPEAASIRSDGTLDEATLANGNKYFVNNVGIGTTTPITLLHLGNTSYTFAAGGLSFGDGDTGFYESSDDVLRAVINGTASFSFWGSVFQGITNGPAMMSEVSSITNPTFVPNYGDTDTGLGGDGSNGLSLITNGSSRLFIDNIGNVGIGTTTFGTNLAGGLAMGVGTAPTGTITGAQVVAANFNGASSARLHEMTQEGQYAALATINETAIYYGVTWDESADTYTRTGRTSGHKTGATLPSSMLPIQRMMERVLLNDDGTVNYVLSPTDSTLKIDGATASVLTGADGQVMVRIPKFWYRYSYTGTTHTWEISPVAMSGFDPHPAFYKDGAWMDYRYIGAYEASLYDVSISAYVDGIYQTAVSAVFDTSDDSITIASRSNWATNLTVGQKLVITGTVSNNATLTVASLVSGTKITVSENLTDETAAATVIATQKDYTATTGDKLSSVSGKAAINYLTRANARVIAANRGAGWRQIDFDLMSAIQMLYLTEYASFYSQSMIGAGITNVTNWDTYNDYNPIALSGNSNSIGNATGNTGGSTSAATESTKYLSYRGIENWFGHLWKWVDGFNINDNIPYTTNNATNWADDTAVNYTRLVNVLGANITLHNADGYPATIQKTGKGFLAASVGASSSTKITDYYYQAAAWRVAFFGGGSNHGADAGGFYWHLDYASGDLNRDFVARLAF